MIIIIYQSRKIFKVNQKCKQLSEMTQQVENEKYIFLLETRKLECALSSKNQEIESTYTALESSESLFSLSEKDLRQARN